jgi:hypothetical protein
VVGSKGPSNLLSAGAEIQCAPRSQRLKAFAIAVFDASVFKTSSFLFGQSFENQVLIGVEHAEKVHAVFSNALESAFLGGSASTFEIERIKSPTTFELDCQKYPRDGRP